MVGESEKVRVFLVEDHPVMRLGLKMMLLERGFDICGEASTTQEAFVALPNVSAHVAIFDLSLNGETIFEALKQVRYEHRNLGIIVYSMHDSQLFVENAMKLGVNAYVTKADPVETLVDAIAAVRSGRQFLGPTLLRSLEGRLVADSCFVSAMHELSERELEVLTLLGRGFGRTEIAASLALSTRTVETFLERLKQKLGVSNNRELLREAIRIIHPG